MARDSSRDARRSEQQALDAEEGRSLLAQGSPQADNGGESDGGSDSDSDIIVHRGASPLTRFSPPPDASPESNSPSGPSPNPGRGGPPRRQSSFAQPRPDGAPRTPNRVRFEVEDRNMNGHANGHIGLPNDAWIEEEDFMTNDAGHSGRRDSSHQRLPLLTDIEAPSVTVASSDVGFSAEDLLESARPKSGMRSAFMNMANSIMYVNQHQCGLSPFSQSLPCANLADECNAAVALASLVNHMLSAKRASSPAYSS